jgi:hypothetical protein
MDTSVFTAVAAVATAVSAIAGLAKVAIESPILKNLGFGYKPMLGSCI